MLLFAALNTFQVIFLIVLGVIVKMILCTPQNSVLNGVLVTLCHTVREGV